MNIAYVATEDGDIAPKARGSSGFMSRTGVLLYGVLSYGVGMSSLFWMILSLAGLVPMGLAGVQVSNVLLASALNIALLVAFGVQHSVMARPWFKARMTRWLPEAAERSTFVLSSGLVLWNAIAFWQPLPGIVWQVEAAWAVWTLWGLFGLGWGYMLLATFAIDHFDLFGLRQVWLNWRERAYEPVQFKRRLMYRHSRHPIMLGVLVGIWATPVMSAAQLTLAVILTAYVVIGLVFEERDLIDNLGDAYRAYRKEVGAFTPWV